MSGDLVRTSSDREHSVCVSCDLELLGECLSVVEGTLSNWKFEVFSSVNQVEWLGLYCVAKEVIGRFELKRYGW